MLQFLPHRRPDHIKIWSCIFLWNESIFDIHIHQNWAHARPGPSIIYVLHHSSKGRASPLRGHILVKVKSQGHMAYEDLCVVSHCFLSDLLAHHSQLCSSARALTYDIYICHFLCLELISPDMQGMLLWKKQTNKNKTDVPLLVQVSLANLY